MARIRTIKPEFPQSESVGRLSRDARLCFVLLWTLADDEGRLRGNSRMLASLLFPYDDDAPHLMDGWLAEIEAECCITRYVVDGSTYIEIAKWLSHQKIDRPSKSKLPAPGTPSRALANPREPSSLDQGPRIKDQGRDSRRDAGSASAAPDVHPGPGDDLPHDEPPLADLGGGDPPAGGDDNAPPPDLRSVDEMTRDELWAAGKSLLEQGGIPRRQCGSAVGKLVKDYGDQVVVDAVRAAVVARPAEPMAYLLATCQHLAGQRRAPNRQEAIEQRNRSVADSWAAQGDLHEPAT